MLSVVCCRHSRCKVLFDTITKVITISCCGCHQRRCGDGCQVIRQLVVGGVGGGGETTAATSANPTYALRKVVITMIMRIENGFSFLSAGRRIAEAARKRILRIRQLQTRIFCRFRNFHPMTDNISMPYIRDEM
jgi:hypothetical protein